jgi:hypothetical protein
MPASRLPGYDRLGWFRHPGVRAGVLYGIYLSIIMTASVVAANRIPALEPFAENRNWLARAAFGLAMALPVLFSFRNPQRLLVSSLIGWFIATLAYCALGFFFTDLHSEMAIKTTQFFLLGAVIYLAATVAAWVVSMAMEIRAAPLTQPRRRNH